MHKLLIHRVLGTLVFIGLYFSLMSVARAEFDPALTWKTITTDHFYIHFHDGEDDFAQRAAVAAEKVFVDITTALDWVPETRTHVILNDRIEITNGNAIPFPDKYINIYASPPDDINSLEEHNGWLEMVIEHEYVHIVHLDKVSGVPRTFRKIFGNMSPVYFPLGIVNFTYPNLTQPRWLIEGLATYGETHLDQDVGRGQSSYFNMLMRIDVDTEIMSIYDANANRRLWPGGTTAYLYGVNFYNFIAERYGKEKIKKLIEEYSDNWLGYFINLNSRQVFRKSLNDLWWEFKIYLREKHRPVIAAIKAKGEVAGTQLTQYGYRTGSIKATGDGSVYFVRADQKEDSAIMRIRPGKNEAEYVARLHEGARFDVSDRGDIVAAQFEFNNNYNMYYELYRYNASTREWRQLTTGGRYHFVALRPDGAQMVAVHSAGSETRLDLLDREGNVLDTLLRGDYNMTISSIDWSPDERHIVAGIWRKDRGWNIEEYDVDKHTWQVVIASKSVENHPQYSADSKHIVFSADYDGVYNIHRLDRQSGKIERLTNLVGGGFSPAATENALYYAGAHKKGFDVFRIENAQPLQVHMKEKAVAEAATIPVNTPATVEAPRLAVEDYSGLWHLKPKWWWPLISAAAGRAAYGVSTSANDPLHRHDINLSAIYVSGVDAWTYSVDYLYSRWWPKFHVLDSRSLSGTIYPGDKNPYVLAKEQVQVDVQLPFYRYRSRYDVAFGAALIDERTIRTNLVRSDYEHNRDGILGASLEFNSATEHALSISPQEGRYVRLLADTGRGLPSVYPGDALVADWREYIYDRETRVIALRGLVGVAFGDAESFRLGAGGAFGDIAGTITEKTFGARQYDIRGYYLPNKFLEGTRLLIGSAEWRIPLGWVQKSLMSPPIGLGQWRGSLFTDMGTVWLGAHSPKDIYMSVGAELAGTLQAFYFFDVPVRVYYAHALTTNNDEVLFRLGWSF